MVEFIDKTTERDGTPINRVNMMAVQGFQPSTISFNADGSITETNKDGHTLTTRFLADGSITQTLVGEKTLVKTTTFSGDTIREDIA